MRFCASTAKRAARYHLDFNDYEDTVVKAELILSNLPEPECPTCGRSYSERRLQRVVPRRMACGTGRASEARIQGREHGPVRSRRGDAGR